MARIAIEMPELGYDMEAGKVGGWLKQVGDSITRGDVIAEIETDKSTVEMEATASGTLAEIVHDSRGRGRRRRADRLARGRRVGVSRAAPAAARRAAPTTQRPRAGTPSSPPDAPGDRAADGPRARPPPRTSTSRPESRWTPC